jgi:hypothetical protein
MCKYNKALLKLVNMFTALSGQVLAPADVQCRVKKKFRGF